MQGVKGAVRALVDCCIRSRGLQQLLLQSVLGLQAQISHEGVVIPNARRGRGTLAPK